MRSMVEGAIIKYAPTTALRAVPLPRLLRFTREDAG